MRTVLGACDVFRGLDSGVLREIAAIACVRRFRAGDHPFLLGQPAEEVFVVAAGRVDLSVPIAILGTVREVGVESRGAGAPLGVSAFVAPHRYRLTARAVTDVELVAIPSDGLRRLLDAHEGAARRFFESLAERTVRDQLCSQALWIRELQRSLGASHSAAAEPSDGPRPVSPV